jgi:hypothetical protein
VSRYVRGSIDDGGALSNCGIFLEPRLTGAEPIRLQAVPEQDLADSLDDRPSFVLRSQVSVPLGLGLSCQRGVAYLRAADPCGVFDYPSAMRGKNSFPLRSVLNTVPG